MKFKILLSAALSAFFLSLSFEVLANQLEAQLVAPDVVGFVSGTMLEVLAQWRDLLVRL